MQNISTLILMSECLYNYRRFSTTVGLLLSLAEGININFCSLFISSPG